MCNVLIPDEKKYINFSQEIHKELHHSMMLPPPPKKNIYVCMGKKCKHTHLLQKYINHK